MTIVQNVDDLQIFLKEFNIEAAEMCNRVAINEWKYALNASDYNKRRVKEFESVAKKFDCLSWRRAAAYSSFRLADTNIKRQLDRIVRQGRCGLNENKFQELMQIIVQMKDNYRSAKICPYPGNGPTVPMQVNDRMDSVSEMDSISGNYVTTYTGYCDLTIDNDLQRLMEISRSEPELRHAFSAFREKVGPPNRNNFMRYVDLVNQAAHIHGFRDAGEQMRAVYDDPDMFFTVQDLWTKIQPLYRQLFTFVRKGLVRYYGESVVRKDGPIPAHLLGNMWAQNWKNILDIVKYRHSETPDVTGEMIKQGYTPLRIFQQAEEFFTSLGLPAMSPEFWRNSILQGTNEANGKCAASAWDFCNNIDFRVKQCTQISIEDFINTHQELAHIQYYMHYTNQPFVYRDGPNPAFHNSIGKILLYKIYVDFKLFYKTFHLLAHAIGLCAGGPVHLQRIGLLSSPVQTSNGHSVINIEYLLAMALDKLPSLAFSLSIEKWRWEMFEKGPIGMNSRWWELRLRYQGIIPPVPRSSDDFDPGAEYHIISDQDHIKYFYSTILQFQIYSELCQGINHVGPLHTCDFYRSREAGRILR